MFLKFLNRGIQSANQFFASFGLKKAFQAPKKMKSESVVYIKHERPIYIFFHVCTIKNWSKIVAEQMSVIVSSGLMQKAVALYIGSNGNDSTNVLKRFFEDHEFREKINFLQLDETIPNENETMNAMTTFSKTHANCNMLYIHTKGVTEKNELQEPWRHYMMRLMVTNHERCTRTLNYFSTVGTLYLKTPYRHYSGNFFWTQSNYMATLDLIKNLKNRYSAEKHILSKYTQSNHAAIGKSWYFIKMGPIGITKSAFDNLDEFEYVI